MEAGAEGEDAAGEKLLASAALPPALLPPGRLGGRMAHGVRTREVWTLQG